MEKIKFFLNNLQVFDEPEMSWWEWSKRNMNIKLLLLGCLVITMHYKEDSMGKVKTYIAIL